MPILISSIFDFFPTIKKALLNMKSPTLQEIIEVVGAEVAAKIVSQIGGVTYYFPPDGSDSAHVAIESSAWQAMCKHFAGWVYIPKDSASKLAIRDVEIRNKRAAGALIIDLAIEYRLSDRRIKTICGGMRVENGKQAAS
jgi:Mor family transcriptional regulator